MSHYAATPLSVALSQGHSDLISITMYMLKSKESFQFVFLILGFLCGMLMVTSKK